MACSGSPWSARRIGPTVLEEITRKLLLTYWNTASFFTLYASHATWSPESASPATSRPILDRWALARLHSVAVEVDERLERYDTTGAGRLLLEFVDDLSNWYVRRSRQRFWAGDTDALVTLYACLDALTRLLAPFVPFVTEEVWQRVIRPGNPESPESVHLAQWPAQPQPALLDEALLAQMDVARAVAEAGRSARKSSGVRIRQPLGRALAGLPAGITLPAELLDDIAEELNVKQLSRLDDADAVLDVNVKPNFRSLGRRFGKQTQNAANAILATDPLALLEQLRSAGAATIQLDGTVYALAPEDVTVIETPRSGWVVESQRGVTIALDTELTDQLLAEGTVRDLVRVVQQARRDAGLAIADRISLLVAAPEEVITATKSHEQYLAQETLATTVSYASSLDGGQVGTAGTAQVAVQVEKA
jgi:isoleucyl-tRNA synthetase